MLHILCALTLAVQANQAPLQPLITTPASVQDQLSPLDASFVASFSDPDPFDAHGATDWEVWSISPFERVWFASAVEGPGKTQIHLGHGTFEGELAGGNALEEETSYLLFVRHRDSSGAPATQWSPWSIQGFVTSTTGEFQPLELRDVAGAPAWSWTVSGTGAWVDLPGAPLVSSEMRLETLAGAALLSVGGAAGFDAVTNPPALSATEAVRLRARAGTQGLSLPPTDLTVFEVGCERVTILLPALQLAPLQERVLWISREGSTFEASFGPDDPTFFTPARLPDPPWQTHLPGFELETVTSGLKLPVDLVFAPDPGPEPDAPLFYVSELRGTIVTALRDGSRVTFASGLLNYDPGGLFPGPGEQGLTGLCIDAESGDLFAAMLYLGNDGQRHPRVQRFTSSDGGRTASSVTTILDLPNTVQGQSHQISNLQPLGDGTLLVHMGDGFQSLEAQNPKSHLGKILRIGLDGSVPADNPFFDASDGIDAEDRTWALGLRNPFGGDLRDVDGLLYEVENGQNTDRIARVSPGINLNWLGSDHVFAIDSVWSWFPARAPVDLAFAQPSAFDGGGFPEELQGHGFVSLSGPTHASGPQQGAKRIEAFDFAPDGSIVGAPKLVARYAGVGFSSISGLAFGPDGLYFATLYADSTSSTPLTPQASVLRLRYTGVPDCNADGIDDGCQPASWSLRSGSPPNPNALLPGDFTPRLGSTWRPRVDHGSFAPNAVLDVLGVSGIPANLTLPEGTLLLWLGPSAQFLSAPAGQAFSVPVPSDCAFLGSAVSVQAAAVDPSGDFRLTNALDLVLGS